jgi:transposase
MANTYREYFDIDEDYFPQVNDSAIAAAKADFWMRTYPHVTFSEMLNHMERVLARQEKRSLWIEGAYGTGKSQCAYALKKILEVPEEELHAYWDRYEPLKKKTDLLH